MIRLKVRELLEQHGKTRYWLFKQMGMSWQNVDKMVNNKTKSINYSTIEALCQLFQCTPNDLFEISEDESETEMDC